MKKWLLVVMLGLGACGDDDGGGGTPDAPVGGGGERPVISMVRWQRAGSCTPGQASNFTVTTTASDPDTATGMLTISGSVSSCTPNPFTGSPATISCPNLSPYPGSVTVRDPQSNSRTATFNISPCTDGMVNP
jgi:hypothetical protein